MSEKSDSLKRAVSSLALVGQVRGEVRRLEAFDKKRHTVPDRVCGATQAFLEKLCESELTEEAEALFQAAREAFGYKRKELSLAVTGGTARLETKDFALELRYELDSEDAAQFVVETSVNEVASRDLLESDAFAAAVGSRFDRLRCGLGKRVSVESVIDVVEDDESGEASVTYPSDCSWCEVTVEGIAGTVFVDGATLEVRFGRLVGARDLMAVFERLGDQFFVAAGLDGVLR